MNLRRNYKLKEKYMGLFDSEPKSYHLEVGGYCNYCGLPLGTPEERGGCGC